MKKLLFLPTLFIFAFSYGQNVRIDIADLSRKIDGKEYATYQFASASYSYSRATLIVISDKKVLFEIGPKLSTICDGKKQEYTDVWILGITDFNQTKLSEIDNKIIKTFFQQIMKYRTDNSLPLISFEAMESNKIFIKKTADICKYLNCGGKL